MAHKIARTIEDLPALKKEHARLVHLTNFKLAEEIAKSGLDYRGQGMVSSTARYWANEHEVEYTSTLTT